MFNDIELVEVSSWTSYINTTACISESLLAMGELYAMGLIQQEKFKISQIVHLFCDCGDVRIKYSAAVMLGLLLQLSPPFVHRLTG